MFFKRKPKRRPSYYIDFTFGFRQFFLFMGVMALIAPVLNRSAYTAEIVCIAVFTFSFSLVSHSRIFARRNLERKLKETGAKVEADITGHFNSRWRPKRGRYGGQYGRGRHDIRLKCGCLIDGRHLEFMSRLVSYETIYYLPDNRVTVYYDRNNPAKYFVDVDGSVVDEDEIEL